ncbi:LOW QUALITY PROTEIN: peroxisomal sarcosine oxidase [Strongylocentrotus purpuratus]|uniref:sarcosine oxidasee (formaldehyde-forming) n=1 Tax=Strongylocentrotus purpuratus TaxID=7668 RepID=A0A7M7PTM7_STRPU|nr:LOW QUALITY PROTEIN: peroxisomal sarcosine oxidase [Strongylocentrotus purpuratus]
MATLDVVVVGAGIEGSSTAYWCAKHGLDTLLLEQFALPHSRSSSHGGGRVIRYAYAEEHYAKMMEEAYPLWAQLEVETNTKLYRKTGMLVMSDPGRDNYDRRLFNVKTLGRYAEEISHEERQRRYPNYRHEPHYSTFIDKAAGVLSASKALKCYQDLFIKYGGRLQDEEKVKDIIPGAIVTVKTSRGEYKTNNVILTPGPWASKLLKPLGLQPPLTALRINVLYWQPKTPGAYDDWPMFLDIEKVSNYVRKRFPLLHSTPAIVETCMYTRTPDNELILDRHPLHSNIIIGCGMSGHGFKLAPVVGKILCQLALGKTPSHDISPCSLRRFNNSALIPSTSKASKL